MAIKHLLHLTYSHSILSMFPSTSLGLGHNKGKPQVSLRQITLCLDGLFSVEDMRDCVLFWQSSLTEAMATLHQLLLVCEFGTIEQSEASEENISLPRIYRQQL